MRIKMNKKLLFSLLASSIAICNKQVTLSASDYIADILTHTDYGTYEVEEIPSTEEYVYEDETEKVKETPEQSIYDKYKTKVARATDNVNIRLKPNTESEILGSLYYGEALELTNILDGWYEVSYNGKKAYISKDYSTEDYDIVLPDNYEKIVMITNDTDMYKTAKYENPITTLLTYECGEVYEQTNGFYFVKTNDSLGYIPIANTTDLDSRIVVVDISSQILKLYNNKEVVLTSPVVSGKESTPSDIGLYNIYSKEQDRYLTGANYSSYVYYWMPYNGGEGLHDATWRYEFGGDIYEWGGSHGCINLPLEIAEQIYNNVEVGTQVLIKR